MIEIISVMEAVCVERMILARKNHSSIQIVGVNRFKQKKIISMTITRLGFFEDDKEECFLKGKTFSGKSVTGFAGAEMIDGSYGKIVIFP